MVTNTLRKQQPKDVWLRTISLVYHMQISKAYDKVFFYVL